jgi:hypothetical protein
MKNMVLYQKSLFENTQDYSLTKTKIFICLLSLRELM